MLKSLVRDGAMLAAVSLSILVDIPSGPFAFLDIERLNDAENLLFCAEQEVWAHRGLGVMISSIIVLQW